MFAALPEMSTGSAAEVDIIFEEGEKDSLLEVVLVIVLASFACISLVVFCIYFWADEPGDIPPDFEVIPLF